MRYVLALCLLIASQFLIACKAPNECSWSEPIRFTVETKDWLEGQEWPPAAYEDFNKIGDHNELYERYC